MAQKGEVFRALLFTQAMMVFIIVNIQDPMELVLDPPVKADSIQDEFGSVIW